MKKINWSFGILAFVFGLGLTGILYAADISETASYHLNLADSYEQKSKDQDAIVAEHTNMPADYKKKYFINEKVTPIRRVQEMEKHCQAIVADAAKLRDEFREFSKWHKMRAAELVGQ